jgi:hypothetical protein
VKTILREARFALLAWLLPFVAAVCIFPLKESHRPLFESLMAVFLATSTVILGCAYLRRATGRLLAKSVRVGVLWMVANWAIDSLMFSGGPMKMTFEDYVMDIGVAYLMIPVITVGLSAVAAGRRETVPSP